MLRFELMERKETTITYRYYPEGDRSDPGTVEYDIASGDFIRIDESNRDEGIHWYKGQMLSRIRKMAKEGDFADKGMVAWY